MKYQFYWRHQPLKLVYLAWVALTLIFIRLPLWTFLYLIPALRPRSSWTLRRSLIVKVLQVVVPAVFNTDAFDATRVSPHVFEKNEEEVGLVWIDPAPELVVGEIKEYARINKVGAVPVPAYWVGEREPETGLVGQRAREGEKVILNFHCEPHVFPTGWLALTIASAGGFVVSDTKAFISSIDTKQSTDDARKS